MVRDLNASVIAETMIRSAEAWIFDGPLHLLAHDVADVEVLSTLLQDAIFLVVDMLFDRDS